MTTTSQDRAAAQNDEALASMQQPVACHGCDLLVDVAGLQDGETALCPRCDHVLTRYRNQPYRIVVAYASAGLYLLLLANYYAFLTFSNSGLESTITLGEAPAALWRSDMELIAVLVAAFIIIIPAVVLLMLLVLCIPLNLRRYQPWLIPVAKGVFLTHNWAMVEVFIIGVIVALVKLAQMATVVLGIAFWAYAGFAICFTVALAHLDRYQCWRRIESLAPA